MRLFIALPIPEPAQRSLTALLAAGYGKDRTLKWVKPEQLHITLRFLGETKQEQLPSIERPLNQIAASVAPFTLRPDHLGAFPDLKRPRVIWVGFTGELLHVARLAQDIERALRAAGLPPETKPFRPHLTLARVGEKGAIQSVRDWVSTARVSSEEISFDRIVLYESTLTSSGPIYHPLQTVPLQSAARFE